MIAKATGMTVEHVSARLNTDKLMQKAGDMRDNILAGKVEGADKPGTAPAAEKICAYMGGVNAHFVHLFGSEEWEDMGDDERDPVLSMALMGVIDKNPAVAEKFLARKDELMGAANNEFNRNDFVEKGHGRKIVEGLYAILVGVEGWKDGE